MIRTDLTMTGRTGLYAFTADRRGVSAIEFALVVPVLVILFLGAVEASRALTVDRRVTSVASAAADLTAQVKQVSCPDIQDIFSASSSILTPFKIDPLSIVLSSVVADVDNKTKVEWSEAFRGTKRPEGSNYTVPEGLTQANSSVIMSEVTYTFTPTFGASVFPGFTMTETFYLRPRQSPKVTKTC